MRYERTQNLNNQKIIDSLNQEIFVKDLQINRYEITLEKLKDEDSICGYRFETIMESETE